MTRPGIFLTAEWRFLVMLNYEVEPGHLRPWLPSGTELDALDGRTLVSMVGFHFRDTRVWGLALPFHRTFEEVNLRFYVRRRGPDGWRRGVVFIKEIVPRPVIAGVARWRYNEPYVAMPMRHTILQASTPPRWSVQYEWRSANRWQRLWATTDGEARPVSDGSEEAFITEHYWGYTRQRDGSTIEYQVEHPRWMVWSVAEAGLEADITSLYGEGFRAALGGQPSSAFVANGSPIAVRQGVRLADEAGAPPGP